MILTTENTKRMTPADEAWSRITNAAELAEAAQTELATANELVPDFALSGPFNPGDSSGTLADAVRLASVVCREADALADALREENP